MKKAVLLLMLSILATPVRAEKLDGGFFTCEVPDTESWQMFDTESGAKNIVSAERNLAVSVSLIERDKGEDLYTVADRLARLHGTSLRRPSDPQDPERDLWEYGARVEGQNVYAQIFEAGSSIAYVVVVGDVQDDDIISIFNSVEIRLLDGKD